MTRELEVRLSPGSQQMRVESDGQDFPTLLLRCAETALEPHCATCGLPLKSFFATPITTARRSFATLQCPLCFSTWTLGFETDEECAVTVRCRPITTPVPGEKNG